MLNYCWPRASQGFSWTICFFLLASSRVLSQKSEQPENEGGIPAYGSVRLVNGTGYSGRVEIYYDGKWGTICGASDWGINEANVVCRSLGFVSGEALPVTGGSENIFLAKVKCKGTEESIVNCEHNNFLQNDCQHKLDAGVNCTESDNDITSNSVTNCNFEPGFCGYTIQTSSDFTWRRHRKTTITLRTGPSADHTYGNDVGYYVYTEASLGSKGDKARLVSVKSVYSASSIQFWYHMYGYDIGTLNVNIVQNNNLKTVWSKSGAQGNSWKYACIPVESTIQQLIFEAIRGDTYLGDMAIDDVILSQNPCADSGTVNCTFQNGLCGYKTVRGNDSSVTWSLISGSNNITPIYDHKNNYSGKYASMLVNSTKEGMKSYLVSPPIKASDEMKLEFFYYMSGIMPGELHVSYKEEFDPLNSWDRSEWHDSGDHGTRWNYGCMDLYPEIKQDGNASEKNIVFTGITGISPGISLAIDDIKVTNGSCEMGIEAQVCTFENPKLCHYTINCTSQLEYTWRRMQGRTPTMNTGPKKDVSKNENGFYLYAESSYGKTGDAVSVMFPVKNTTGKYLKFNYHMYGQSMGSLHLFYKSGQSSRQVWQISGNQGNVWNFFCRQIGEEIDEVNLVAVRGSSYTSDIAVDDVSLTSQPCINPFNCDFENGPCNYTQTYTSSRYKWILVPGNNSPDSLGNYLLAKSSTGTEGNSTTLTAIFTGKTSINSSIQFYYKIDTIGSSKLIVEIKRLSALTTVDVLSRKYFNMAPQGWVIGCIDLPEIEKISANFIVISGSSDIMLDNISYNKSSCVYGIVNDICTFDDPNGCGYKVSCRDATKFLWKRKQRTNSSATGPSSDHSGTGSKYFMYTESSFGDPGDTTELEFPEFITPPGHYLSFYYYMYGRDIGTLQVHIITPSGKMLKWYEKGEMGANWVKGCVSLPANEKTTVVFTGIRGNGPLGDMAIDDVGVVPGDCHDQGIPCEFKDETICGYRNVSHLSDNGWVRRRSGSDYYMNAVGSDGKLSLESPLGNLSDSCIQISYQLKGSDVALNVYTSYNNQKYLSLKENNNKDWQKAQFYIQNAETRLIFEADKRINWTNSVISIDKIDILNGKCPDLDCMNFTQACNDQGQCVDKSSICDKEVNCYDGSDEGNCSPSISCDFEHIFICDYHYKTPGWSRKKLSTYGLPEIVLNNSEYSMLLPDGMSILKSPYEVISKTCVQFYHIAELNVFLEVKVDYSNGTKLDAWSYKYTSFKKWTLGQFEIPGGNVSFEFVGFSHPFGLAVDNINLQNGSCGTIVCPDYYFACGSNEKCIPHRNKCDRTKHCDDNSDEVNCTSSINCDVEDPYQCGYQYSPDTWKVSSGKYETYPDLDHTSGLYSGKFFVSIFSRYTLNNRHDLHTPGSTLPVDACLTFYYSLIGFGELQIFDNGVIVLKIRSNDINTWQKSQIQLRPGKHKITFRHIKGKVEDMKPYNVLALDSIDLSNGTCGTIECEKGWRKCSNSPACLPEFKFCDHDEDCADGEDEQNCKIYSNVRLVRGRNIQQGDVEIYYNGKWSLICGGWTRQNAVVACRELGYNVSRKTFAAKNSLQATSKLSYLNCSGSENSLMNCNSGTCIRICSCLIYAAVDCSNTPCESTHVPCMASNATSSSNTSNPQCISKESVCDGEMDCPGGTDEQSCTKCKSNEFQCRNYECIPQDKRCDGISNCNDGSDEYHCFKLDNLTLSFMMNGTYTPVCIDNVIDQDIANKLCHYVGKGNASASVSSRQETGVKFSLSPDSQHSVLPGFKASLAPCPLLNLQCRRRECGTRSANLYDPVIRYGQKAIPGEWPWQVAVFYRGNFTCGGVLLNNQYIISAAYCFQKSVLPEDYEIGLGSIVRSSLQKINVRKIKLHQNYSSVYKRNDIVLLELMTPVQTTDYIRPACLPSEPWEPHMPCYTTGWGVDETNQQQNNLMETKVKILPRHQCYDKYTETDATGLCANHNQPYQPGCYADEGGPLVCRNMQGYWSVYGVMNQGLNPCDRSRSNPQLYADIFMLRKWITDNMMN